MGPRAVAWNKRGRESSCESDTHALATGLSVFSYRLFAPKSAPCLAQRCSKKICSVKPRQCCLGKDPGLKTRHCFLQIPSRNIFLGKSSPEVRIQQFSATARGNWYNWCQYRPLEKLLHILKIKEGVTKWLLGYWRHNYCWDIKHSGTEAQREQSLSVVMLVFMPENTDSTRLLDLLQGVCWQKPFCFWNNNRRSPFCLHTAEFVSGMEAECTKEVFYHF